MAIKKRNKNNKSSKITIDDLAAMVKSGFKNQEKVMEKMMDDKIANFAITVKRGFDETAKKEDMDKKFHEVDKKFVLVYEKINHTNTRIDYVAKDIKEIKDQIVPKLEIEDLSARVKYVGEKMGIDSGK